MGTIIKATCQFGCGDIRLDSNDVTLRIMKGREDGHGEYRFVCPKCHVICLKDAPPTIVEVLKKADITIEIWELPLELLEQPKEGTAEPISYDDILELGLALEADEEGWMNKMKWGKHNG